MNNKNKYPWEWSVRWRTKSMHMWAKGFVTWFTLVELIVVISILGILGLIAFTSISGYVSSARDATRASDISSLFRGVEISIVKHGVYPTPDNVFTVAYSGGSVWAQGTAGDSVFRVMDNAGVRSSKKLTDPLLGTEYGYATLSYGKAYQFRADWEGDTLVRGDSKMVDSAYAAPGNPTIAYIKGNYAGYVAKTLTGGMTCILAVPSLIVSQSGAALTGSVDFLSLSNRFLMHGQSNTQGVRFTPQPGLCFSTLPTDDAGFGITNIMTALQTVYSGSDLVSNPSISNLLSVQSGALVTLGIPVLEMGLNIDITGTAYPDPSAYSSGTTYSPTGNSSFTWSGTTVHVTGGGIGFTSSRADPLCDTNDISIWQPGTNNVQTWSACNIGATLASAGTMTSSCFPTGCSIDTFTGTYIASLANLGSYFQWGNNAPITYLPNTAGTGSRSATCGGVAASSYSGATNFILSDVTPTPAYDWCTTQNDNLWGSAGTSVDKRGPCPTGYHVPTGGTSTNTTDWGMVYMSASWSTALGNCTQSNAYDRLQCALMLPYAGYRLSTSLLFFEQWTTADYWSSSPKSWFSSAYALHIRPSVSSNSAQPRNRANGFPVRCIKN